MVKVGPRAVPTQGHMRLTQWVKLTHRAHTEVNNPRGAILRVFSPSGCAPIPPASTTDQNHSKEIDLGGLYSTHQGADPTTDRAATATEPRGSSPQYPGQARVIVTTIKSLSGDKGTNLWANLTHEGADITARGTRILQPS